MAFVDADQDRLTRAGWSVGDMGAAGAWLVTGGNGEDLIRASGATEAATCQQACAQAAVVGMPAAAGEGTR